MTQRSRQLSLVLEAVLIVSGIVQLSLPRLGYGLTACTANDIISQNSSSCPSGTGACTITKVFDVGNGCILDFGTRSVSISSSGQLNIGPNSVTLKAGTLLLQSGSLINGRGSFVPTTTPTPTKTPTAGAPTPTPTPTGPTSTPSPTSTPGGATPTPTPTGTITPTPTATPTGKIGGMMIIQTTGTVTVNGSGVIDVSAYGQAGTITITAGGTVSITGQLFADGLSGGVGGGTITVDATGDVTTQSVSVLSALGSGEIDLFASGNITTGSAVRVNGSDGGSFSATAGAAASIAGVLANAVSQGGSGGSVSVVGGTTAQILGDIQANGDASLTFGAGSGGCICIESDYGDTTIAANIQAQGATPDGLGGDLMFCSVGKIALQSGTTVNRTVSANSPGGQGCGGLISAYPTLALTSNGLFDASGGLGGGNILISGTSDVTISACPNASQGCGLDASASNVGSFGGQICVEAGASAFGNLSIQSLVNANAGLCDTFNNCGLAGCNDLTGCNLTIGATGRVTADAALGGNNTLTARERLTISGPVDATSLNGTTDGTNDTQHPSRKPPLIGANLVTPANVDLPMDTCTTPLQINCLTPCPVCGNGVVEFPEQCDNGTGKNCSPDPLSSNWCSSFCQYQPANCDDMNVCTIDSCDLTLGCRNLPVDPALCPTSTPTLTPTITATFTVTPTITNTNTSTATPTVTPTPPPSNTPSITPTRPPTLTPTITPTATQTPVCFLDVDKNRSVDAATDTVYMARRLLGLPPVPGSFRVLDPSIPPDGVIRANVDAAGMGLDVDRNGVVDPATDIPYIARQILGLPPVPPHFRILDPSIPPDSVIADNIVALCP